MSANWFIKLMKRYKDINECLMAGVAATLIASCIGDPEIIKPDKLKGIYEFEREIWEKFHPSGADQLGLVLPWGNYHGSSLPFRFRRGELTVWTGYNKHGKSEVLNHCVIDLCWQGEKALICSLEVQAPETYRKLIRMSQGRRDVANVEERHLFAERCLRPLASKVWVYDHVGSAGIEEVLNVMLYAYQRFGVRQFVLDSFMRFQALDGDGQEMWNLQKAFMDRLLTFAATYQVHIHLVAHSKKPNDRRGEAIIPRRYDIKGSASIPDLAFNVIVVWRNKGKQDKMQEIFQELTDVWIEHHPGKPVPEWKRLNGAGVPKDAPEALKNYFREMLDTVALLPDARRTELEELMLQHDAYFIVDAQRGGDGDCPARHLWFHYDSLQFLEVSPWDKKKDSRQQPRKYAEEPVQEMDELI